MKEIRFGPQTDDHDYNFKLKHAQNFLKEGAKVKAYVFFRGRSIVFKEQGEILLLRFATDLEEFAKVEAMPRLDGKKMNMMLAPKVKKVTMTSGRRPRNTRENNDGGTEISGPQVVVFAFTGMGSPDHVVLLRRPALYLLEHIPQDNFMSVLDNRISKTIPDLYPIND